MLKSVSVAFAASLFGILTAMPASALVPQANGSLQQQLRQQDQRITEIRARGGAASRTTVVRGGAVVRPGYPGVRPGYAGGWARPGWYRWPAGGAIAAGAALGFVTAAAAASYAGAAPSPGMCWYYTDPGRTQGFWDTCP